MKSFGMTDKGAVRQTNQDCFVIENRPKGNCTVAVVCDGMGGARAGDFAGRLAAKTFVSEVYGALPASLRFAKDIEKLLKDGCRKANGVVYEYARFEPEYDGMGTTIVGGVINGHKAYLVNAGDSRAYHLRRKAITQITKDHSYVQELVSSGAISAEEARNHPKKNIITRALGVDKQLVCDYFEVPLRRGDAILLCSDGLSNTVTDAEILKTFEAFPEPRQTCEMLMALALERGARDNVSVVVIKT